MVLVVIQPLSCVRLFAVPWTAASQDFLSFTVSQGLLKFMSIQSVMPSSHLVLCHPLLLLLSIFPSIQVFLIESALHLTLLKTEIQQIFMTCCQNYVPICNIPVEQIRKTSIQFIIHMDCLFYFKGIHSHVKLKHISFSTASYYRTPLENLEFIKDVYTIILPKIICKILVWCPLHFDILSCAVSYITIMCVTEKNAQCESCELSFIWDNMSTIAPETASQTSLRNCLEKVEGRSVSM